MHSLKWVLLVSVVGISASAAKAQTSQQSASDASETEEIVVTAEKRPASAQRVPITITALSGAELVNRGITDTVALTKTVPGLSVVITSGYSGKVNYTLRGVGLNNFSETQEAAVAVYQDEVYIAPSIGAVFSLYDTDRVEVLRGPQGSLFGRSASGGLVHYLSRTPGEQTNGYLTVGAGSFGERTAEGATNLPLSDKAALRVSGRYYGSDGWIKNSSGGHLEAGDLYSGRVQLKLAPTDRVELILKAEYGHFDSNHATGYAHIPVVVDAAGVVRRVGPDENVYGTPGGDLLGYRDRDGHFFEVANNAPGRNKMDRTLLTGHATWDLGAATLTSITGYLDVNKNYFEDTDASPNSFIHITTRNRSEEFQQELRLNGEAGRLKWLVGGFYFNYDVAFDLFLDLPTGIAPLGVSPLNTTNIARQSKESFAGFGQLSLSLSDQFSVQVGARVEREKADFSYTQSFNPLALGTAVLGAPPMNFTPATAGRLAQIRNTYASGDITLNYHPSANVLVYSSLRRGIKPGGFNTPLAPLRPQDMKFSAEKLDSLEAGVKTDLADRRVRLNLAVYHYWYNDYQAVQFKGVGTFTTNADARVTGADFELQWVPSDLWSFGVSGDVLDATAKDIALRGASGVSVRDRQLPNAPRVSVNGFVQFTTPVYGGKLRLRADGIFRAKTYFELQNHPADAQQHYATLDLGASWTRGPFELGATLTNALNKKYYAYIQDVSDFTFLAANPGRRRWGSAHLTYRW